MFAGEFYRQSHGEVRIKLPSSKAQNWARTIVFTPPEKRVTYHPSSSAARLISWVWLGKQKHRDLKWKDFSLVTPCLNRPWSCVQVGLEMVKYNGCSVWPEGRKPCSSLTLGNRGSTERLPQFITNQSSSQRKWVSAISLSHFPKWHIFSSINCEITVCDIIHPKTVWEQKWFLHQRDCQENHSLDESLHQINNHWNVLSWRQPGRPPTLRTDCNVSDGLCFLSTF